MRIGPPKDVLFYAQKFLNSYMASIRLILAKKHVHMVHLVIMIRGYVWIGVSFSIPNSTGWTQLITCAFRYVLSAILLTIIQNIANPHALRAPMLTIQQEDVS